MLADVLKKADTSPRAPPAEPPKPPPAESRRRGSSGGSAPPHHQLYSSTTEAWDISGEADDDEQLSTVEEQFRLTSIDGNAQSTFASALEAEERKAKGEEEPGKRKLFSTVFRR